MPNNVFKFPVGTCTYIVDISWQECWYNDETEMVDIEFSVHCAEDGEEVLVTDDPELFWEVDPDDEASVYACLVGNGLMPGADTHVMTIQQILNP